MSEREILAVRAGYSKGIVEQGKLHEDIVVLEGDVGHATGTLAFKKEFPDRFYEGGIAEQNLVGMAAGMALSGLVPFVSSFAIFTAGRACEIVRNAVCYNRTNVKLIGSHCGVTPAADGGTHMCIEDIAWMKAIPEMVVVNPCDYNQIQVMVKKLYEYQGPAYMRSSREPVACVTSLDDDIEIGKAQILKDGTDIAFASTGIMTPFVMEVAEQLEKEGVSAAVLNYHTIKPLDEKTLEEYAKKCGRILTVEEHNIHGGFAESCAISLIGKGNFKFGSIAVMDRFGETGNRLTLFPEYGLDNESIYKKAKEMLED